MSDATYTTKVYEKQGGDELVVANGGKITIEAGGKLFVGGADVTAAVATGGVAGVAAGYGLARSNGVVAITRATNGDINTGPSSVVSAVAVLSDDAGLSGDVVTCVPAAAG